jgi:hypothetical protein
MALVRAVAWLLLFRWLWWSRFCPGIDPALGLTIFRNSSLVSFVNAMESFSRYLPGLPRPVITVALHMPFAFCSVSRCQIFVGLAAYNFALIVERGSAPYDIPQTPTL